MDTPSFRNRLRERAAADQAARDAASREIARKALAAEREQTARQIAQRAEAERRLEERRRIESQLTPQYKRQQAAIIRESIHAVLPYLDPQKANPFHRSNPFKLFERGWLLRGMTRHQEIIGHTPSGSMRDGETGETVNWGGDPIYRITYVGGIALAGNGEVFKVRAGAKYGVAMHPESVTLHRGGVPFDDEQLVLQSGDLTGPRRDGAPSDPHLYTPDGHHAELWQERLLQLPHK